MTDHSTPIALPPSWTFPIDWTIAGWPYLAFAFLVGSIPFGLVISRVFFRRDLRTEGSGNIGAANALRTLGPRAGAAVLVLDALKGIVAVAIAWQQWLFVPLRMGPIGGGDAIVVDHSMGPIWPLVPLAGIAAMLGHIYTPWLRFRGGKGVATYLGAAVTLSWEAGLAFAAVWLAIVLPTGFASAGSIAATAVAGATLIVFGTRYGDSAIVFAVVSFLVILWKHRENVARLLSGTENRLDLFQKKNVATSRRTSGPK